jgi:hypothetical protein
LAFEALFHTLHEPYPISNSSASLSSLLWDRGGFPYRRAYYSKFLILSGGQDQNPGVFLYSDVFFQGFLSNNATDLAATFLIANEGNAMQFGMDVFPGGPGSTANPNSGFAHGNPGNFSLQPGSSTLPNPLSGAPTFNTSSTSPDPTFPLSYDLQQAGQDDITNHNLQATGGIGGSG